MADSASSRHSCFRALARSRRLSTTTTARPASSDRSRREAHRTRYAGTPFCRTISSISPRSPDPPRDRPDLRVRTAASSPFVIASDARGGIRTRYAHRCRRRARSPLRHRLGTVFARIFYLLATNCDVRHQDMGTHHIAMDGQMSLADKSIKTTFAPIFARVPSTNLAPRVPRFRCSPRSLLTIRVHAGAALRAFRTSLHADERRRRVLRCATPRCFPRSLLTIASAPGHCFVLPGSRPSALQRNRKVSTYRFLSFAHASTYAHVSCAATHRRRDSSGKLIGRACRSLATRRVRCPTSMLLRGQSPPANTVSC